LKKFLGLPRKQKGVFHFSEYIAYQFVCTSGNGVTAPLLF